MQWKGDQKLAAQARRDMRNLPVTYVDSARVKALNAMPAEELAALVLPVPPAGKVAAPGGTLGSLLLDPTYNLK